MDEVKQVVELKPNAWAVAMQGVFPWRINATSGLAVSQLHDRQREFSITGIRHVLCCFYELPNGWIIPFEVGIPHFAFRPTIYINIKAGNPQLLSSRSTCTSLFQDIEKKFLP